MDAWGEGLGAGKMSQPPNALNKLGMKKEFYQGEGETFARRPSSLEWMLSRDFCGFEPECPFPPKAKRVLRQ
jgi:hypothetical protein